MNSETGRRAPTPWAASEQRPEAPRKRVAVRHAVSPPAELCSPERMATLAELGLTEDSDPGMERFVARVRAQIGAPVALVSLVHPDRQVFPGQAGLPEPWASRRSTPLSHSFCQHVVRTGQPLVTGDARIDPLLRDSVAVRELGVVAYAGMPLVDGNGIVLGSLCALDLAPREWSTEQTELLAELARDCSTELQLRLARHDAARERDRKDASEAALRLAYQRSQFLLGASQTLSGADTVVEIRQRLAGLGSGDPAPTTIELYLTENLDAQSIIEDQRVAGVADSTRPARVTGQWSDFDRAAALPTALSVEQDRLLRYADPAEIASAASAEARRRYEERGLRSVVCAPITSAGQTLGVLEFGWDTDHRCDPFEQAVLATLATYTAHALDRVRTLQHRITVAHQLQGAMLSGLPAVPGLELAARYLAAQASERIGGDWYDAVIAHGHGDTPPTDVAVTVGDVTGHDMQAAALMGQLRSMLRQSVWAESGQPPASVISSVESACADFALPITGTLVHAHLRPVGDGTGRWAMSWTNAGHPPPILIEDGATTLLADSDILFGFPDLRGEPRSNHRVLLRPGAIVLLYTDGLIEQPGRSIRDGIDRLCAVIAAGERTLPALMDTVMTGAADFLDDVVVLAVRIPPDGAGSV